LWFQDYKYKMNFSTPSMKYGYYLKSVEMGKIKKYYPKVYFRGMKYAKATMKQATANTSKGNLKASMKRAKF